MPFRYFNSSPEVPHRFRRAALPHRAPAMGRGPPSISQHMRSLPRGPSAMAPAVDENAGHLAGGRVAAHHDVGVAALLEVRIEDRLAGRAPAPPAYLGESAILH